MEHRHEWKLLVSTKVWVYCACGKKFKIPAEATGSRYHGHVPLEYQ